MVGRGHRRHEVGVGPPRSSPSMLCFAALFSVDLEAAVVGRPVCRQNPEGGALAGERGDLNLLLGLFLCFYFPLSFSPPPPSHLLSAHLLFSPNPFPFLSSSCSYSCFLL